MRCRNGLHLKVNCIGYLWSGPRSDKIMTEGFLAWSMIMDFIENVLDMGAAEISVTGISRIERITAGQIRMTYFSRRPDGDIVAAHVIWDYPLWQRAARMVREVCDQIGS